MQASLKAKLFIVLSLFMLGLPSLGYSDELPVGPVASLPTSDVAGSTWVVTDGTTRGDCTTGGGKFKTLCVYSGSYWATAGEGILRSLGTKTNCSGATGTCVAAPAGSVSIAAAATTVTVATTMVTANSQIFIQEDSSLGTKLSITCNTTLGRSYAVTARTAATSFVITSSAAPSATAACLSYFIVN